MTDRCEILVLYADDRNATLCSNVNGVTKLLREIDCIQPANTDNALQGRHVFACELMMALGRSARERACDGVVIFAEGAMMDELRQVQTSTVSRLMIGHIVGKPSQPGLFPGRSAANAQRAFAGAVH